MGREDERLLIGEVARLTGFPTKTLRYYEDIGLVRPTSRTQAGYRLYGPEEVARLGFVRQAKLIGLKLEEIKELVDLAAEGERGEVIPRLEVILEAKIEETRQRMAELAEFQEHLLHYRRRTFEADPAESCGCGDGLSFCGCQEAVTEDKLISPESLRRQK
ncbi:MAG: MerR family transcriptional regulator [Actinomycetota bacterium]|nr:MerR family transcriptional regulator [Actinomycetota bacterium]